MASLDRAFPLAQMDTITMLIRKHLYLNMPGAFYISFNINGAVLKRSKGLVLSCLEINLEFTFGSNDPHPPSAPTGSSFDDHRKADLKCELFCFLGGLDRFRTAWEDRNTGSRHRPPCLDLVTHHRYNPRCGADELDIAIL